MWEFFDHVFSQGGFVALTAVASVAIFGGTVRVLWNANQGLHRELRQQAETFEKALRVQAEMHMLAVTKLHEQRHDEATATQERVLQHLTKVDSTLAKVGAVMDTLVDVVSGRRNRPGGG